MPPAALPQTTVCRTRAGRIDAASTILQKNESRNGGKRTGRDESLPYMGIESRKIEVDGAAICRENCATYGSGCATKEPFPAKSDLFFEMFPQKQAF